MTKYTENSQLNAELLNLEMLNAETLDTQGLFCPEPIMMLHAKMDDIEAGSKLLVLASDPATKRDVAKFCQFLGHKLLEESEIEQVFHYLIEKC